MINTQFMLTKNDVTIPNALEVYAETAASLTAAELPYVGFKTIGLPAETLRELGRRIVGDGRELVVEIVGASNESERNSAALAVELGATLLLGGTHTDTVLDIIRGEGIGYYPTVGDLATEPGRLHGTINGLVADTRALVQTPGVDGVMLLGYRYVGDASALVKEVGAIEGIKAINAGSVDSAERINELKANGFWGFTIGSAVLDCTLPAPKTLERQLRWVLDAAQ